jgi:hypothetical protein
VDVGAAADGAGVGVPVGAAIDGTVVSARLGSTVAVSVGAARVGVEADGVDPAGVGVAGVLPHAARRTPRRRDAARCFAFICRRRWCCGLSRR